MSRRDAGFTLIEMLVALTILGVVATVMASGLSFLAKAEDKRSMRTSTVEGAVGAMGLVRESLGRAQPYFRRDGEAVRLLFEGSDVRLRFVAREPGFAPGPSLVAYQYSIGDGGDAARLELRRAPIAPGAGNLRALDEADPRLLLNLPTGVRFSYFEPARRGAPAAWSSSWAERRTLPAAVRLARGGEPQWSDLVVRLAVDTAAVCPAKNGDSPECRR